MNPVGTKEQREELRREYRSALYKHAVWRAVPAALDGLDIAEEMVWLLGVEDRIDDLCWDVVKTDAWQHWADVALQRLKEAVRRWQAWQRGGVCVGD